VSKTPRLSEEKLRALREAQRIERERRTKDRPSDFFPWHEIQKWILQSPDQIDGDLRIMLIAGGNRGGKSKVAMGLIDECLRRVSGLNKQFLTTSKYTGNIVVKTDRDPVTIWVVPPTLEKARQDWLTPQDGMGLKHWCGNRFLHIAHSPDLVLYCRPPGRTEKEMYNAKGKLRTEICDKILIKSQDQKLETFESSEVDVVVFDEEVQREEVWASCQMRIGTTHGVIVMAYTPLHGLSWSWKRYWKPLIKEKLSVMVQNRCWIHNPTKAGKIGASNIVCAQMGSADNPRARSHAAETEADHGMGQAEKDSRLYGEYGYVEGSLLPALAGIDVLKPLPEHEVYVVDELPDNQDLNGWFLVSDPNKSYGAVLSCADRDGNMFFVCEHLEEAWPDRMHADAFKEMEKSFATGPVYRYADPGSAGAQSIVNMAHLGIPFNTMPKGAGSVSASVKKLRGLTWVDPGHLHPVTKKLGAPRVYFYRPGLIRGGKKESDLASQLSQARQTSNQDAAPDTPHKDNRNKLDLFDCARYTAVVFVDMPVSPRGRMGRGKQPADRLEPWDITGFKGPGEQHPLDEEVWLPEYDFGYSEDRRMGW